MSIETLVAEAVAVANSAHGAAELIIEAVHLMAAGGETNYLAAYDRLRRTLSALHNIHGNAQYDIDFTEAIAGAD